MDEVLPQLRREDHEGGDAMRYISLFSGIEAASVAWAPLGWEPVAFSEIEPFCCELLAERFPDVPNLGDVSKVDWTPYEGTVDVVIGGSPCQAFSIAGQRKGLMDERGMLMLQYVRAVREIKPRFIIWENVPGVLSQDKGRAFGTLLGELEDCGYSLAWRVLDAQFFGVAQRRRRVFLVGHPVAGCAAAVLFEPESLRWDHPSSREAREELARAARQRAQEGGGPIAFKYSAGAAARTMPTYDDGTCNTLTADWHAAIAFNGTQTPTSEEEFSPAMTHEGASVMHATALRTANTGANGSGITDEVAHTIDTTGPEAVAFAQNTRDEVRIQGDGTISGALSAQSGMKQTTYVAQRMAATQYGEEVAGTLTARHDSSPCADRGQNVVCLADDNANAAVDVDMCGALKVGGGGSVRSYASNGEEVVGSLCARDYKGVGNEYVGEGKVICQVHGSCE